MLRIFDDEKMPENEYIADHYDGYDSGYESGQDSILNTSKSEEWLDSGLILFLLDHCPIEWFGDWSHRYTLIDKIQHSDKPFSQFLKEKMNESTT